MLALLDLALSGAAMPGAACATAGETNAASLQPLTGSGQIVLDPAAPRYSNARYGFSLSLPPGEYQARSSDNGDGLRVQDGRGLVLLAYGTMAPGALGQGFAAMLAELAQGFDTVTYRKTDAQAGWFVVSGYRGGKIGYVKCFFRGSDACIVDISYPKADKARYDALVTSVARSITAHAAAAP